MSRFAGAGLPASEFKAMPEGKQTQGRGGKTKVAERGYRMLPKCTFSGASGVSSSWIVVAGPRFGFFRSATPTPPAYPA